MTDVGLAATSVGFATAEGFRERMKAKLGLRRVCRRCKETFQGGRVAQLFGASKSVKTRCPVCDTMVFSVCVRNLPTKS